MSPASASDVPGYQGDGHRICLWCRRPLEATATRWCSKRCRQTAWRSRRIASLEGRELLPATPGSTPATSSRASETRRLAYADPPYPGLARYYRDQPTYAGEVDHARLLGTLATYDGWALSTSQEALRDVLALCPRGVEVCPWTKTHHPHRARGPSNIHEYLLVMPARRVFPGVPDALVAAVARGGDSDLIGRKPLRFCAWLFALLGAQPQDTFDDLFPGSGVVGRSWAEFRRASGAAQGDVARVLGNAVLPEG